MPLYDLVCPKCNHIETNVTTSADKINHGEEKCPECGESMKINYMSFRPTVIAET